MMNPHVYLINLEHRTDRLKTSLEETENLFLKPEIVVANSPGKIAYDLDFLNNPINKINRFTPNCYALNLTVIGILKDAIAKNYNYILILEDDVKFLVEREQIDKIFSELPEEWDLLYLGAYHWRRPEYYSPNLVKAQGCWTSHAILYHSRFFSKAVGIIETGNRPIDLSLGMSCPKINAFAANPNVAVQHEGISDNAGGIWRKENIPLNPYECKEIDPIEIMLQKYPCLDIKKIVSEME